MHREAQIRPIAMIGRELKSIDIRVRRKHGILIVNEMGQTMQMTDNMNMTLNLVTTMNMMALGLTD
jgi:hypothetical protein